MKKLQLNLVGILKSEPLIRYKMNQITGTKATREYVKEPSDIEFHVAPWSKLAARSSDKNINIVIMELGCGCTYVYMISLTYHYVQWSASASAALLNSRLTLPQRDLVLIGPDSDS
jgi:hypothetical protein